MKYIYKLNDRNITNSAFTDINGIWRPKNWLTTATDDDLTQAGVVKDIEVEPDPVQETETDRLLAQAESVRVALNEAVKARFYALQAEIGAFFQSSAEFKTFAGFTNVFQMPAQQFGAWEAEVWHQANLYKTKVMNGQAPMISPKEAVAMMPSYPLDR